MKKWCAGLLLCAGFACIGIAQSKPGVHQYMAQSQGTIALSISNEVRYNLYGELGFMVFDQLEINGSVYGNLGSSAKNLESVTLNPFDPDPKTEDFFVHALFFGPNYHFRPHKPLDLYLGMHPGAALVVLPDPSYLPGSPAGPTAYGAAPLVSLNTGVAYYASFFHLFAQLRFVAGRYRSLTHDVPLSGVWPAFGLGFNVN